MTRRTPGRSGAPLTKRLKVFFQSRFLPGRMQKFITELQPADGASVLDIGGTAAFWDDSRWRTGANVTLLNLELPPAFPSDLHFVQGDATNLPFADNSFDIVFSNSMIEHLHTRARQEQAAREAMRVGRRLWIQTPNRWFPIEPHYLTLFIHWLPKPWRTRLVKNFTLWGLTTRPTAEAVSGLVEEIRLLSARELAELFPDCRILRERFLGMTKSLIATR